MKNFIAFVLFLFLPVCAFAEYFDIKNFEVDVEVLESGVLVFEERILVDFHYSRQGIFRTIPYISEIDGKKRRIRIGNIDSDHEKVVMRDNGYVKIRLGTEGVYHRGERLYNISYEANHAVITDNDDYDEIYWNVIGTEWPVNIYKSRVVMTFPTNIAMGENIDYRIYYGAREATNQLQGQIDGRKLIIDFPHRLSPYQGITVQARIPKGIIHRSPFTEFLYKLMNFLRAYYHLIGMAIFLLISFRIWWKHGKDERIPVMTEFFPPKDVSPSDAKSILSQFANFDLPSTVVDLAQRGFIKIGQDKDGETFIEKVENVPENAFIRRFEEELLDRMFKKTYVNKKIPNRVYTSSYEEKFFSDLAMVKNTFDGYFKTRGFFEESGNFWRGMYIFFAVVSLIMIIIGLIFFENPLKSALLFVFTTLCSIFFAIIMPKKTVKGLDSYGKILGFREFMRRAEEDRIRMLLKEDPHYFDETIPYAIIFGMENRWGKLFNKLLTEPPQWYSGNRMAGAFMATYFIRDLRHSLSDINSSAVSQPAPEGGGSGGGFSGGSFGGGSGGGFGGGGGGSW
jgi:hypothetical protein